MNVVSKIRLDKTAFSVGSLHDEPDERAFWWSKTPQERWSAMEFLRQLNYGYDPDTARLERVLEFVECEIR